MKCDKKFGELGSGIPWTECGGELTHSRDYDKSKSVLFGTSKCNKCGNTHTGILWQR